jgi:hypothetical protein
MRPCNMSSARQQSVPACTSFQRVSATRCSRTAHKRALCMAAKTCRPGPAASRQPAAAAKDRMAAIAGGLLNVQGWPSREPDEQPLPLQTSPQKPQGTHSEFRRAEVLPSGAWGAACLLGYKHLHSYVRYRTDETKCTLHHARRSFATLPNCSLCALGARSPGL